MELVLQHATKPAVRLQWDKQTGTLSGDDTVAIEQIKHIADLALKQGYISHVVPCVDYPVLAPLKDQNELALIVTFLEYSCEQLPIPTLNDEYSDIVVY